MSNEFRELPDGAMEFTSNTPFTFDGGGQLDSVTLVYETYGELNTAKDNAILVHHALSTNHHLASTEKNPADGWWENMVEHGGHLDKDRYFIICINNLGSCFGSSGPASINPATGKTWAMDFPATSITDMVRSQKLLIDALGINHLRAVLGNSMGAMLSLAWLTLYPDHADYLISISSCAQSYPANNANRGLQADSIKLDPEWNSGNYDSSEHLRGFIGARKLGLLTYRNWAELNERFVDKKGKESIDHYLLYNAQKFVRHFDCNSYLYLLAAMDSFNLHSDGQPLADVFRNIRAKALVVSVDSDILFTPSQQRALYEALCEAGVGATFIDHHSTFGHDAFLIETEAFGTYVTNFLEGR